MARMFRLVSLAAFVFFFAGSGLAQTTLTPTAPITFTATVTDIDYNARLVTVRGSQGAINTFEIPSSVTTTQLNSIRVGDVITVTYSDAISVRRKPAGEAPVDTVNPTTRVRTATVAVTALDPAARSITFTGPRGRSFMRHIPATEDASVLSSVSVGDRVDVSWYETMQIAKAGAAVAEKEEFRHRFTISALWGWDNQFSGKMIKASSGTYGPYTIDFDETTFDDVYGRMGLFKVGIGYRTSPRSEVTANLVFSRSGSDTVRIGTVGLTGTSANVPIYAKFDDYNYWGLEFGQRFYFARARFTPFLGYYAGINRFDAINGEFSTTAVTPRPPIEIEDRGQFFDASWAFSFGPTGGILIGVGPFEIMGQVELRYMGGLSDVDPLSQAGLKDINSESSRWSFPFLFGARIRF